MSRMKHFAPAVVLFVALASTGHAQQKLVYLSCDVPSEPDKRAEHFDFTLDEANGTVSYFVTEANALNKEKAVFSADTVTWTVDLSYGSSITRMISRVTLKFEEVVLIANHRSISEGTCKVVTPPERKF